MDLPQKYQIFIEEFYTANRISESEGTVNIFDKMKSSKKFITEWQRSDLDTFIKGLRTISVNSINKYLQYIRKFYTFACQKENIKPIKLYLTYDLKYYIDYNKLLSVTLDENRYNMLRGQLIVKTMEGEFNHRDKLLVELAWEGGLTASEIKSLQTKDINIVNDEYAIIKLPLREVIINDAETIDDIRKTIKQDNYYIVRNGKAQKRDLRITPYLIRNIETRKSSSDIVSNPAQLLKKAIAREEVIVPDIDIYNLSLEDIRRSKVIYLFKNLGWSLSEVKTFSGKKTESDLYWIEELAYKLRISN